MCGVKPTIKTLQCAAASVVKYQRLDVGAQILSNKDHACYTQYFRKTWDWMHCLHIKPS